MVIEGPWMRSREPEGPKFPLGKLVATPNALRAVTTAELSRATTRHHRVDWGELDPADKKANEEALAHGGRLLSAYQTGNGTRFWIITEADRSVTTVLLPEDY